MLKKNTVYVLSNEQFNSWSIDSLWPVSPSAMIVIALLPS